MEWPLLPNGQKLLILRCLAGSGRTLTPAEILARDENISEAGIYVALARMKVDGWLDATKDATTEGQRGSPHRRFAINGVGRQVLKMADELEMVRAGGVRV
jgi:DNA-binding PadR family transcriptional regulator